MSRKRNKYELSTMVYKVDFEFLLDNFLNQKLWGKTWTIFDYNDFKITLELDSIEIKQKKVSFYLRSSVKGELEEVTWIYIPYEKEHRNLNVFKKQLDGACINLISKFEKAKIRTIKTYQNAVDLDWGRREMLEKIAEDFLNKNNVYNKQIRDAYIDNYIENNYNNLDFAWKVLKELEKKVFPELYMSYYLMTDNQESYEYFVKNHRSKKKKSNIEFYNDIKQHLEDLENGNFYRMMSEKLEDI